MKPAADKGATPVEMEGTGGPELTASGPEGWRLVCSELVGSEESLPFGFALYCSFISASILPSVRGAD